MEFRHHDLSGHIDHAGVLYEEIPVKSPAGDIVDGLHAIKVVLDNPSQLNSYTTEMIRGVILGMRKASNDRRCVAVVLTASGTRSFCTGGVDGRNRVRLGRGPIAGVRDPRSRHVAVVAGSVPLGGEAGPPPW